MDYRPLFNRDSYSRETISKFDILGSYFVNTFYNVLYTRAKHHRTSSKNHETLTYHYKELLEKFSSVMRSSGGVTGPCREVMKDLYEYYIEKTRFKSYTYSDFLSKLTSEFLPADFSVHISNQQKQKVFEECIVNAITSFEQKIRRKYITNIIDNHKNAENIQLLRDIFIDCLIFQREEFYNKIAKRSTEHHIPKHIADKLNEERNNTLEECRSIKIKYEHEKQKHEHEKQKLIHDCEKIKKCFMVVYTHVNHRNDLLNQLTTKSDKMSADLVDKEAQLNQTQTDETDLKRDFEQLTLKSRMHDKIVAGLHENIRKLSDELATTSENLTTVSKKLSELKHKYHILAGLEKSTSETVQPNTNLPSNETAPRDIYDASNLFPSHSSDSIIPDISSTIVSSPASNETETRSNIDLLDAMLSEFPKSTTSELTNAKNSEKLTSSTVSDKPSDAEMDLGISFYDDNADTHSLI